MSKHNSQQPPKKQQPEPPKLHKPYKHCEHSGTPVTIGGYNVGLGGRHYIPKKVIYEADIVCPLNGSMPNIDFGKKITVVYCELQDYGGVPKEWEQFIQHIAAQIRSGKKVLGYCTGGHGRTGTFAASLIAVLEPQTQDPIAAIRQRYCKKAVETLKQADAVFKFRGTLAPKNYADELDIKHNGQLWGGLKGKSNSSSTIADSMSEDDFVWDPTLKIWKYPEDAQLAAQYAQSKQKQSTATKSSKEALVYVPDLGKYVSLDEIEEAWRESEAL